MSFPTVYWPAWDADAAFFPCTDLPANSEQPLWAVLAFVFHDGKVVLADIADRGYCIPSGKIEAGESPIEAAKREAFEESGARFHVGAFTLIGYYALTPRAGAKQTRCCPVFVAEATGFEPIPAGSESKGLLFAELADVPGLYFFWDDLMAAVFAYAYDAYQSENSHRTDSII